MLFSEQYKEFNRILVKEGISYNRRDEKMQINNKPSILINRDYDFSSDVIEQFGRKWGI